MPSTLHLRAEEPGAVEQAAAILRSGGLVAFPTETVYGLGANALSAVAVERIFEAKQRPSWDPLIVHVASVQELGEVMHLPPALGSRVEELAAAFWPGPLTLLLPRRDSCPDAVTAGRSLVGLRVPAHPVAQALLRACGLPLAAPSANRFGHVSPTTAQHVLDDLNGRIDAVLDGGAATVGVESTVLDPGLDPMLVYRAGAVTVEALRQVTGIAVELYEPPAARTGNAPTESLPSPGVGLRHYAPEIRLQLTGPTAAQLLAALEDSLAANERPCVLLPGDWPLAIPAGGTALPWGIWSSPASLAVELFQTLRAAEKVNATLILCPLPEPGDLREALRDRLLKASKPR